MIIIVFTGMSSYGFLKYRVLEKCHMFPRHSKHPKIRSRLVLAAFAPTKSNLTSPMVLKPSFSKELKCFDCCCTHRICHSSWKKPPRASNPAYDQSPACQPDQSTECTVQLSLEHLQGQLHHIPEQSQCFLTTLSAKKFFLISNMNLP